MGLNLGIKKHSYSLICTETHGLGGLTLRNLAIVIDKERQKPTMKSKEGGDTISTKVAKETIKKASPAKGAAAPNSGDS